MTAKNNVGKQRWVSAKVHVTEFKSRLRKVKERDK